MKEEKKQSQDDKSSLYLPLDQFTLEKAERDTSRKIIVSARLPIVLIQKAKEMVAEGRHRDFTEVLTTALFNYLNVRYDYKRVEQPKPPQETYCPLCEPYRMKGTPEMCNHHKKAYNEFLVRKTGGIDGQTPGT